MSVLSRRFATPAKKISPSNHVMDAVLDADIPALIKYFTRWRKDSPDVVKTVDQITKPILFSRNMRAIIAKAAQLAAEPNNHPYHNNVHFLEVFTLAATMGYHAYVNRKLSQHHFGLLLTAALIHDYKHDGTGNQGHQFRLEDIAMNAAEPHLVEAGATYHDLMLIRAFIRTTDVSKDFSNPAALSPAESVKLGKPVADTRSPLFKLKTLYDQQLTDAALMLADADLGANLLSAKLCEANGRNVAAEANIPYNRDNIKFFLEKICHKGFFSSAGRELFQPHANIVLDHFGVLYRSHQPGLHKN